MILKTCRKKIFGLPVFIRCLKKCPHKKTKMAENQNNAGFTLLEVLVAMVLLSVSLVIVMQLFSGGLRSSGISEDYTRAVFHAREKMEEALVAKTLGTGEWTGDFGDGFQWRVAIGYPGENAEGAPGKAAVSLFRIDVDVFWKDGENERHVELSTLKIAKPERES